MDAVIIAAMKTMIELCGQSSMENKHLVNLLTEATFPKECYFPVPR